AIVEIAHRLAKREPVAGITDVRGTAFVRRHAPDGWIEIDSTTIDAPGPLAPPVDPYAFEPARAAPPASGVQVVRFERQVPNAMREKSVVRMPAYDDVRDDPVLYAHASRILHVESNPGNARALVQRHGDSDIWLNPPPVPLATREMDAVYELPYRRVPH